MTEFLQLCFSGPLLPATCLMLLVSTYWLFVIVGAVGLDWFDFDLDVGADVPGDLAPDSLFESVLGAGAATLRFLNLGSVPIMLWLSVFALAWWVTAFVWRAPEGALAAGTLVGLSLRNGAVAVVAAKVLTQPLRGRFEPDEPAGGDQLIGQVGEVVSYEATPTAGQGKFPAAGSPLLLNVRTEQETLAKGETIRIVEYRAGEQTYLVERLPAEPV